MPAPMAAAPSIGNYKGVMLCNRPFAGTGTAAALTGAASKGAAAEMAGAGRFITGVVKSEVGFSGALRKEVGANGSAPRPKKDTALTRHRRWLSELQRTKEDLSRQHDDERLRKEESKRRFMKREAQLRSLARASAASSLESEGDCKEDDAHNIEKANEPGVDADDWGGLSESESGDDGDDEGDSDSYCLVPLKSKRASSKPAWALTEKKAVEVEDRQEEDEVEKLLNFTRNLDFEKYIQDAEVQSMIDQVKKRILSLEALEQKEGHADVLNSREGGNQSDAGGDGDDDALEAQIMRLTKANLRKAALEDSSAEIKARDPEINDDARSIARTVLSEGGRSVWSVHSHKSLAAVAERAQAKILEKSNKAQQGDREEAIEVKVALHLEDDGLRKGGRDTVSMLPYLNRNPAV